MERFDILSIVIFATILAITAPQAYAVGCWKCDSDHQAFCGEQWDSSKVSAQDKTDYYWEDIFEKGIQICSKGIVTDGGVTIKVVRSYVTDEESGWKACDKAQKILRAEGRPNAIVTCSFCKTNGCNGEVIAEAPKVPKDPESPGGNGASQYGPIVLLIALPVAIAKIFLF